MWESCSFQRFLIDVLLAEGEMVYIARGCSLILGFPSKPNSPPSPHPPILIIDPIGLILLTH